MVVAHSRARPDMHMFVTKPPQRRATSEQGRASGAAIRVAIVDDHPVARYGVEHILAPYAHLNVVCSTDRLDALPAADVYLLDLYLGDGRVATGAIGRLAARNPVLVMSASIQREDVLFTLEAGASGFLTKDSDGGAFVAAIEAVAAGGLHLSSQLADIIEVGAQRARPDTPLATLAPREREVLSLLAEGFTQEQAAVRLGVASGTVDTYLKRIRVKLGPGNKAALIRRGIDGGHITR
jgi:DNA-binding NarL/FixJ family response regulator